jgi:hypothetical protein
MQRGWLVIQEAKDGEQRVWTFTPKDHPASPSVVKRRIFETDGTINLDMDVLCEAEKHVCDELVREFQALTAQMRKTLATQ